MWPQQSVKTKILHVWVNYTHLPSLLPSQGLGLSEEQPEHPPRPRSFAPQSNRGRTRKLLSASRLVVSVVSLSSSSDMMLFTRHVMAASMLVLSCKETEKDDGFISMPKVRLTLNISILPSEWPWECASTHKQKRWSLLPPGGRRWHNAVTMSVLFTERHKKVVQNVVTKANKAPWQAIKRCLKQANWISAYMKSNKANRTYESHCLYRLQSLLASLSY